MFALAVVFAFTTAAGAVSVPADFLIDSNNSTFLIDVSVSGISDSDSTSVSGSIETLLDIGSGSPLPPTAGLTVTGGRIDADEPIELAFNIFLLLDVDVLVENISATIQTPLPPGTMTLVNPTTGQYDFDLAEHEFTVDQGTITASGHVLFDDVDSFLDLSEDPVSGGPDPGEFIGSLTLQETGSDATSRFFHADLFFPVDILEDIPLDDGGALVATVSITGSLVAAADFAVPLGLPGDYNDNGMIDAADYTAWRDAMTDGASALSNDPTPGSVDDTDFDYWRAHFGEALGSGAGQGATAGLSGSAAVPEPASWLLMLCGVALLQRWAMIRFLPPE
jgi:hypothetical protein